jgi:membrane associated rhomboid family serine protease
MPPTDGPLATAGRNLRQLGKSPGSWGWVVVILAIQGVVAAVGGAEQQPAWSWFEQLGLNRNGILSGKWWQFVTYGFLHGGWWHAILNALCVLLIGSRIEHMVGRRTMALTLSFGILGGGIGHVVLAPGGPSAPLLVGLSGGCLALLLMLTTLSPQSRMMPLPITGRSLGAGILGAALILVLIHPESPVPALAATGRSLQRFGLGAIFEMGHGCHFGGGMAGWIYGRWVLRPRITLQRLRRDRERREASEARKSG